MRSIMVRSIFCAVFVSLLFSCESKSEDGDWEAMKWATDVKMDKGQVVTVPATGGTYVFKCKNYGSFWLSGVLEDGKDVGIDDKMWENAVGEWSSVEVKKNVMTVTLSPNNNNSGRLLDVTPTAGDIFSYFSFKQAGKSDR